MAPPYKTGQAVEVKADGRVGVVVDHWARRTDAANFALTKSYKYQIQFPDGRKEFFFTKDLKAK